MKNYWWEKNEKSFCPEIALSSFTKLCFQKAVKETALLVVESIR